MSKPAPAITPHKQCEAILTAVSAAKKHAPAWAGTGYRLVAASHATPEQMLSGIGSQTFGARWNPPGSFPAVYCSLLPETAVSESMNRFRRTGLKPRSPLPGVLVSMKIKLYSVLDFSKPKELHGIEPFLSKATKENWQKLNDQGRESTSQAIVRRHGRRKFVADLASLQRLGGLQMQPRAAFRIEGCVQ